jgi:hypothetical protein
VKILGIVKAICGLGLIAIGVFMFFSQPTILDCNKLSTTCPSAFNDMLATTIVAGSPSPSSKTSEIQEFCECFSSCMNYMLVYEHAQTQNAPDNCFPKSVAAGVPSLGTNQRRLKDFALSRPMNGTIIRRLEGVNDLLGVANPYNCGSCEDIVGGQQYLFGVLGTFAIQTGIVLLISGLCEHYQIKLHSTCFSFLTFAFDVIVVVELFFVTLVSLACIGSSAVSCDPDTLEHMIKDAGQDSTNSNEDSAAAFAHFFLTILAPMASGICSMKPRFAIFFVVSFLGWLSAIMSTLIVALVCMGCTVDGKEVPESLRGSFDTEAEEMQSLIFWRCTPS